MRIRWCVLCLVSVIALVMASTACQLPAREAAGLAEEDVAAIRAVFEDNKKAGLAGDWESFFSHFTEDAVIMWPHEPAIVGLETIKGVSWVRAIEFEDSIVEVDGR